MKALDFLNEWNKLPNLYVTMEIKHLTSLGFPKKSDKSHPEKIQLKNETKKDSVHQGDQAEISKEATELQNSADEVKLAKELLKNLPKVRAYVIYEALAKLRAGIYSSDKIISDATSKLLADMFSPPQTFFPS